MCVFLFLVPAGNTCHSHAQALLYTCVAPMREGTGVLSTHLYAINRQTYTQGRQTDRSLLSRWEQGQGQGWGHELGWE